MSGAAFFDLDNTFIKGSSLFHVGGEVLHGPVKATAVAALAAREGFDLGQCMAYSDSINDLPLLDAVAYPHAVNPDRRLRRIAVQRGWQIHDFRARRRLIRVGAPAAVAITAGASLLPQLGARTRDDG